MAGANTNRTAYLRLNHPTQPNVFEVVQISQTILSTTTIPVYNFDFIDEQLVLSGTGSVTYTLDFTWDGPQTLGADNFQLTGNSTADNATATLPQIQYGGSSSSSIHTVTTTFSRGSSGVALFNYAFNWPGTGQTGTAQGDLDVQIELTILSIGGGPGGGPGGCHLAGTNVLMSDGTNKLIEEIVAGDEVVSYGFNGLSQEEEAWNTWSTIENDFVSTAAVSEVKSIGVNQFNAYRKINTSVKNDHIRITYEHPVLVKRGDEIRYMSISKLTEGDKLYYRDLSGSIDWIDFVSMETVQTEEVFTTYTLDVEKEDSYLANGLVAHNIITDEGPTDFIEDDDDKTFNDGLRDQL